MSAHSLHAAMRSAHTRGEIEITAKHQHIVRFTARGGVPITRVKAVPLCLSMLDLNRESHYYSPAQCNSLINEFNGAELHIADTVERPISCAYQVFQNLLTP